MSKHRGRWSEILLLHNYNTFKNMVKNKLLLKALAGNDAVFDEETGHRIIEINGELVEQKYCAKCREWHSLSQFCINKNALDGLFHYCRKCNNQHTRDYKARKKGKKTSNQTKAMEPIAPIEPSEGNSVAEHLDCILKEYTALQERNAELERKCAEKPNYTKLTEQQIETILKENPCPPRVLFNAIMALDNRYDYYAVDKVLGTKTRIVKDSFE